MRSSMPRLRVLPVRAPAGRLATVRSWIISGRMCGGRDRRRASRATLCSSGGRGSHRGRRGPVPARAMPGARMWNRWPRAARRRRSHRRRSRIVARFPCVQYRGRSDRRPPYLAPSAGGDAAGCDGLDWDGDANVAGERSRDDGAARPVACQTRWLRSSERGCQSCCRATCQPPWRHTALVSESRAGLARARWLWSAG